MYADQLSDLFSKLTIGNKTLNKELFVTNLKYFEERLAKNFGYLASSKLTYADLYLSSMLENLSDLKNETLKDFPHVANLDRRIRRMPRIKSWLARRAKYEL
jgi:glutathione S-transferase